MRFSRPAAVFAVLLLGSSLALRGDTGFSPRAQRLGNQMICTCGCTQNMLTCTTLGCTVKLQMQAELRQRAASTDSDSLILQSFVQEYGTQVMANPTTKGFNVIAWIMPWIALGLGLLLVLFFVKRWRHDQLVPALAADPATQSKVQAEIQAALEDDLRP